MGKLTLAAATALVLAGCSAAPAPDAPSGGFPPPPSAPAPAVVVDAGAPGHSLRHPVEMHLRSTHDDRAHVTCWANVDEVGGTYSAPFCLRDVYPDAPTSAPEASPQQHPRKGPL